MKLIDADKLLEDLKQKRYSKQSLELIQSQPEVDAIPVSWIKNHLTELIIGRDRKFSSSDAPIVYTIIADWKEANNG